MRTMFVMMNAARLFTGVEGVSLGEIAYQAALDFAKERRQSRAMAMDKRETGKAADTILVHPDVRRMLLDIKSTTEALRGLSVFISANIDLSTDHPDEETRQEADDLVALMIPIMKAYGTERGFKNVSDAMQVCGGMGYTVDGEIEQYLRDLRIAMIYEGTNHIQALDLVGRKLGLSNGRLYQVFGKKVRALVQTAKATEATAAFATKLGETLATLDAATMALGKRAGEDPEVMGASASTYLTAFGLVVCGFSLLTQANHAVTAKTSNERAKLGVTRHYFDRVLPEIEGHFAILGADHSSVTRFADEDF
ncbi:MAG: acyl-CoA dehydrogenase C-terminal domain-containing protein [Nannocystaceae bacterium]|nr:acyl-CoA dehydrogenase C-terminal domain-containing protein [Nannocystaceae bacterium]